MDPIRPPDFIDYDNPYAPPRSTFEPERTVHSQALAIPFSIDSIVSASWWIFRNNLGQCVWAVWPVMLVNFGIGFALSRLQTELEAAMPGDQLSSQVIFWTFYAVSLILQTWLGIGMNLVLIRIVRGERASFDQVFGGGRYLLKVCLVGAVLLLMLFGAALALSLLVVMGLAAFRNQPLAGFLTLVAFVAAVVFLMVYLCARLMQFYFLIIDRDAGIIEALPLAWQITRGKAGTIILVYLMQLVFVLGGILALCVGLIFTVPLSNLLLVVTYLAMAPQAKTPERMPFTNWEEDVQGG